MNQARLNTAPAKARRAANTTTATDGEEEQATAAEKIKARGAAFLREMKANQLAEGKLGNARKERERADAQYREQNEGWSARSAS